MAYITGSVTGHDALMTVLRDFLTTNAALIAAGQNWALNKEATVAPYTFHDITGGDISGNFRDMYFDGPGLAGQDSVIVNIRQYQSTIDGYNNWAMSAATGFDTLAAWEDQPGIGIVTSRTPYWILTNAAITYWIVANGRRFILVCKIEGDYHCSYNGLILPYGKPSEFPYPIFVSGTSYNSEYTPSTINQHNFYRHVVQGGAHFRRPSGVWSSIRNGLSGAPEDQCFPYYISDGNLPMYGNPDGSFTLLPIVLQTDEEGGNVWGEFQGLFYVPRNGVVNLASEDTLTIGGDTYLVFQDMDDQGENSYCAMLLE